MPIYIGNSAKQQAGTRVVNDRVSKERRKMVKHTKPTREITDEVIESKGSLLGGRFFFSEEETKITNGKVLNLIPCGYVGEQKFKTNDGFIVDKTGYVTLDMSIIFGQKGLFSGEVMVMCDDKLVSAIPFNGKDKEQVYTKQILFFEKGLINFRIRTKGEKLKILGIQTGYYSQIGIDFNSYNI